MHVYFSSILLHFCTANSGAAAGGILFLVAYIPYTVITIPGRWETATRSNKLAVSLLSNSGMALGCRIIADFEITGTHVAF